MGYPSFGSFWAPPYGMPPMMPPPQWDSAPSTHQTNSAEPSSDPPDAATVSIYSPIETFMESLALRHPQCNLDGIGIFFMSSGCFHIDEVMKLLFGITVGKARFILNQVDDEIRHVEREAGCKRRNVCA